MATLYDYFAKKGQRLPSVDERRKQFGLGTDYIGTSEQNTALLRRLEAEALKPTITPPAPAAAPIVPKPKVDLSGFTPELTESDRVLESLINQNRTEANKKVDESKIRRKTMEQFQAEFDAIEQLYSNMLNQRLDAEKPNEEKRFDALRASQARGGLLGSGRGSGQVAQVDAYNADIRGQIFNEITAKKSAAIAGILGEVRQANTKAIEEAREAKRAGADNLIKYLASQQERTDATTNTFIKRLIAEGIDVDELSPEELAEAAANLKVSVNKLTQAYSEATAGSREQKQQVSRQNAILGALKQGVNNPADILDILNFDDEGNQVGDITLEEVSAVLKAVQKDPKVLSEGQVLIDPNTGKVIYKNPKTYKPDGGGNDGFGGGGNTPTIKIPSFEEWVKSDAAKGILEAEQNRMRQSFAPEKAEAYLREQYDAAAAEVRASASNISTGRLTAEDKQQLTQAGLSQSETPAQVYFSAAEPAFRQWWTRGVATGDFPVGATLDEIDAAHIQWEQEQAGGGDDYDF